jgi:ABC-type transporter Mla subunit MlaD
MHAIERPHLPRVALMYLGVVLVAIMVLLLVVAGAADSGGSFGPGPRGVATARSTGISTGSPASRAEFQNPFVVPFSARSPFA